MPAAAVDMVVAEATAVEVAVTVVADTEDIEYPSHSSNVKKEHPHFHPTKHTPFSSNKEYPIFILSKKKAVCGTQPGRWLFLC